MKSCQDCRDRLSPYLEGELEREEASRLEGHLDGCASCRAELELLRLTVESLRGLPDLPAPAGILEGVREGMAPLPWYRRLVRTLAGPGGRRLPLGAFATLLVAFGIFTLTERYPDIGQPPPNVPRAAAPVSERTLPKTAEEVREEADKDDSLSADPEESTPVGSTLVESTPVESTPAAITTEEKVVALVAGDGVRGEERERRDAEKVQAEGFATLSRQEEPAVALQGKGEAVTGPSYRTAQGLAKAPSEIRATGQIGTAAPPEVGERSAFIAGSRKELSRDLVAADRVKRKKAAPLRSTALAPSAPAQRATGAPAPLGPEDEAAAGIAAFADERGSLRGMTTEKAAVRTDDTELFTIVSLTENEMGELRRSLREAGGQLLEMKTIDAYSSQQMALPYQNRIPESQMISRGWQIRATVPRNNVERFVDSLSDRQALQVLHRAQVQADWDAEPGSQKIEINLVR